MSKTLERLSTDTYDLVLASDSEKRKSLTAILCINAEGSYGVYYIVRIENPDLFNRGISTENLKMACEKYDEI